MQRTATLASAMLLVACSSRSPDAKLAQSLDAPASALAGAAMTGEKFVANSVPRAFVENSLDSTSKELEKTEKSAQKEGVSLELRRTVEAQLNDAKNAIDAMRNAVETNDKRRVMTEARKLEAIAKQLRSPSPRARGEGGRRPGEGIPHPPSGHLLSVRGEKDHVL